MTPEVRKIAVAALVGALSAARTDFKSWQRIREAHDPSASFDWALAVSRWVDGAIVGGMTGAGLSMVG